MRPSVKLLSRIVLCLPPLAPLACGTPSNAPIIDEVGPRKTNGPCTVAPGQCLVLCYEKLTETEACLVTREDKETVRAYLTCAEDVSLEASRSFQTDSPCCWAVGTCTASGRPLVVAGFVVVGGLHRGGEGTWAEGARS